jgi:molybdopterin/thiamine biosynthesis adenylyltransferase/rhodanese-related sulfurtransferase
MELSPRELQRYDRHLLLPQIGKEGQERLKKSSVLCIGAGGLGSPAALYLASAGVGRIGIVDADQVDLSNLQRQILHDEPSIGLPKTVSAARRLEAVNSDVHVEQHEKRLVAANAVELFSHYDLILDGSDNFPTRFLANDTAFLTGTPLVSAAIFQFEGQLTVFSGTKESPCYRCLLPEPPPPGTVPSCNEAGVIGALTGVVGTLQAMEALKILLGLGEPLLGRMLHYDALRTRFNSIKLPKNPSCALCGSNPSILEPVDYQVTCSSSSNGEIDVRELRQLIESQQAAPIIDVRSYDEYAQGHLPGSELIPLEDLEAGLSKLSPEADYFVFCHRGQRSAYAAQIMVQAGFSKVRNITGGILAWQGAHGVALLESE